MVISVPVRRRLAASSLFAFVLFFFLTPSCWAEDELFDADNPVQTPAQVRILYVASTRGELLPCPT
jgi:hypothetical protein